MSEEERQGAAARTDAMVALAEDRLSDLRYYLGRPVYVLGDIEDGWQWAEWPNGARYRHWAAQLREEAWE